MKFRVAAVVSTRTSPGPGVGSGNSRTFGPPARCAWKAHGQTLAADGLFLRLGRDLTDVPHPPGRQGGRNR